MIALFCGCPYLIFCREGEGAEESEYHADWAYVFAEYPLVSSYNPESNYDEGSSLVGPVFVVQYSVFVKGKLDASLKDIQGYPRNDDCTQILADVYVFRQLYDVLHRYFLLGEQPDDQAGCDGDHDMPEQGRPILLAAKKDDNPHIQKPYTADDPRSIFTVRRFGLQFSGYP